MEEMKLIHKVENGELDMLGYVMLNPELKEPFSDYARGNGITCPTAADAVRYEGSLIGLADLKELKPEGALAMKVKIHSEAQRGAAQGVLDSNAN